MFNNILFISICTFLVALYFATLSWIPLALAIGFFILNIKTLWIMPLIVCVIFIRTRQDEEVEYSGTIIDKVTGGYKVKGDSVTLIYTYQEFDIGNEISWSGSYTKIGMKNFNDTFKILSYNSQNINYQFSNPTITLESDKTSTRGKIVKYLDTIEQGPMIKMIGLNIIDESNSDFYNNLQSIGLSHIVAISAFHITLLFNTMYEKLKSHFEKDYFKYGLYLILFFYGYLLNFKPSFLKAFIMIIYMTSINKNPIKAFGWSALITTIIHPLKTPLLGYVLSFGFSFAILFMQKISNWKRYLVFALVTTAVLPIYNYEFNLLAPLITAGLSSIMIASLMPIMLNGAYEEMVYAATGFISKFNIIITTGAKSPIVIIATVYILYKLLINLYITRFIKYPFTFYVALLLTTYNLPKFNFQSYITFINVGQGDSALLASNNSAALIDAAGSFGRTPIIDYLKYEGVSTIDKMIITHDDSDHSGSKDIIEDEFKVGETIEYFHDSFQIGACNVESLKPSRTYESDNDKSIINLISCYDTKVLMMGDVSKEVELDIIDKFPNLRADILKVGHHGSNTSTDDAFIKHVNPTYAILSYGKNNFGHPHNEVLNTLKDNDVLTYSTYLNGSIKYDFKTKKIITANMI